MDKNIINATFVSVWDGGTAIETECKINTITREVFDIISVEADVDVLERQYVIIDGQEYDVVCVQLLHDAASLLPPLLHRAQPYPDVHRARAVWRK